MIHFKNGKQAARFEVVNSKGLVAENLTGLIGEAMLPKDYTIDPDGHIHVGDNIINSATVKYMEHDKCHFIPQQDIHLFYKKSLIGTFFEFSEIKCPISDIPVRIVPRFPTMSYSRMTGNGL